MPNTTVCPLAKKCGGCQLQNLSYDEQLHLKQATAIRLLGRFGHVEEIIGMKDPYHYRNKVQAAFAYDKRRGRIISGVYQSSTHRIGIGELADSRIPHYHGVSLETPFAQPKHREIHGKHGAHWHAHAHAQGKGGYRGKQVPGIK